MRGLVAAARDGDKALVEQLLEKVLETTLLDLSHDVEYKN